MAGLLCSCNNSSASVFGHKCFVSSTSDKVSVSGNQITLLKAGSVTINADQTGNTNFNAATSVPQVFCINPAKPIISLTGPNSSTPVLTSSSASGNQWYKDGAAISDATSVTFAVSAPGVYTVKSTIDNCISELSVGQPIVITGDIKMDFNTGLMVYPNPTKNTLILKCDAFDPNNFVDVTIYDATGKVLDSMTMKVEGSIAVGTFLPGEYILNASQSGLTYNIRFIKE